MDILKLALAALLAERSVENEEGSKDCEKTNQDK
ncbi:hypothetical protein HMPREF9942_00280 [Fusobacterium animalis F0419]|uniref:Uncharacterized protein n=1 Tax=Fusobacterium animalis F0419 TaxID=999414 RepID=H1HCS9_9FUSO|nr:hypothetical protein HMPREF9942_00280 [Fusobacterium animalis F0419]